MMKALKIALLLWVTHTVSSQSAKFVWSEALKPVSIRSYVLSNTSRFLVIQENPALNTLTSLDDIKLIILDKKTLKVIKTFERKGKEFEKQREYGFDKILLSHNCIFVFVNKSKRGDVLKYAQVYDLNGNFLREHFMGQYEHGSIEDIEARNNFNNFHLSIKNFNSGHTKFKKEEEVFYDKDFKTIGNKVTEDFAYFGDVVVDTAYGNNNIRYELVRRYTNANHLLKANQAKCSYVMKAIDETVAKPAIETPITLKYQTLGSTIQFKVEGHHIVFKSFYNSGEKDGTSFDGIFSLKYNINTQKIVDWKEKAIDKTFFFQHLHQYNNKDVAYIKTMNILESDVNEQILVFEHCSNHGLYGMGTEYGNVLGFKLTNGVELTRPFYIAKDQEYKPKTNMLYDGGIFNEYDVASSVYNFVWENKLFFIYNDKQSNIATNTSTEIEALNLRNPSSYGTTLATFDRNNVSKKLLFGCKDENKAICFTVFSNYKVPLKDKLFYARSIKGDSCYFGILQIEK